MKIIYKPKTKLEKFGSIIFNLLVENFPRTYFVGGAVRDLALGKNIFDIDIATSARPEQVVKVLADNNISTDSSYKKFGNVVAKNLGMRIEITTFRKDLKSQDRYNTIKFVNSAKEDSKRRDFTVNSLYLSPITGDSSDFHKGFSDIKKRLIRFIGKPDIRIKEDPLRIIRALRFALVLNFKLEKKTKEAIKNNYGLINFLTKTKIEKEILKIKNIKQKNILKKVINNPAYLDKYFK